MFSTSGDHLEGKRISERYRIKSVVKWTEHTVFCIAEDLANGLLIDMFLLDPSAIKNAASFKKQIQKKTTLKHKNLRRVLDAGQTADAEPFIACERVAAAEFTRCLNKNELSAKQSVLLVVQVIDALIYLSKMAEPCLLPLPDVLEFDSKGQSKSLKITALKFAPETLPDDSFCLESLTLLERAKYIPPECIKGKKPDARSQAYVLGCVLYQLLSGHAPFETDDLLELESQHLCMQPKRIHEIRPDLYLDPRIEAVITRALSKEPAQRQNTLAQLKLELLDSIGARPLLHRRAAQVAAVGLLCLAAATAVCNLSPRPVDDYAPVIPVVKSEGEPVSNESALAKLPLAPDNAIKLGTIRLGGTEKKELAAGDYVCEGLFLSGNARLQGNGNVHLWVQPQDGRAPAIEMTDSATVAASNAAGELAIYDMGFAEIKLSGKANIKASVQAPAALLQASDNATIQGSFESNGQILNDHAKFINSTID